jgi:hypothetical protein
MVELKQLQRFFTAMLHDEFTGRLCQAISKLISKPHTTNDIAIKSNQPSKVPSNHKQISNIHKLNTGTLPMRNPHLNPETNTVPRRWWTPIYYYQLPQQQPTTQEGGRGGGTVILGNVRGRIDTVRTSHPHFAIV